jgi:endonuclease/exonuclease/phosphatase family metal-dependent hydrolase
MIQWVLLILMVSSAFGPLSHSGLLPFFQVLPSFDIVFWTMAFLALLIAGATRTNTKLGVVVLVFATCLLMYRTLGKEAPSDLAYERKLTVLSVNVGQFSNDTAVVNEVVHIIQTHAPDLLCLQEFGLYYKWPDLASVSADFSKRVQMPYFDFTPYPGNIFGTAIFSKYPIEQCDTLFSMLSHTNEAKSYLIHLDSGHHVRIMNMHLQSYNIMGHEKTDKSLRARIDETLARRHSQVHLLLDRPADLLVGDMNASPGSIYYRELAGRYRDAQRSFGQGLLPTHAWIPTRLDYILVNKNLPILRFERLTDFPSDHYGLFAEIGI